MSSSSGPSGSSSIQVVVRLRPMNEKEKKHGTLPVVTALTKDKTVTVIKGQGARQVKSSFSFDNVFTAFSSQEEVFEETLKPVIGDVMRGYESTVFAYGQTGTGKTHTMEGDLSSPEMHGVIPRSAQAIFETLKQPQYFESTVTCSYLEIYNEDLSDLLTEHRSTDKRSSNGATKLEIMEGKNGTFCRGLLEKEVGSAEDVLGLMQKAQQQRKIGETKMNKHSSRSHCIFTMRVQAKATIAEGNGVMEYNGKLHMVDLAGSECAKTAGLDKASGAEVARERERMNINRSLLTLGRVISLLKEQNQSKRSSSSIRIPYRDSKLTRILQESLGGRCKTVIVATLSPSITAIEESISTLNYAQSANGIINKPVATSYLNITPNKMPNSSSNDASGGEHQSVEHWHEMECRLQYMQAQVEEAQAALARKHDQHQELVDRVEKAEADRLDFEKKLYDASTQVNSLKEQLAGEVERRQDVETRLRTSEVARKQTSAILKVTKKTEADLTREATALLSTLEESVADSKKLHAMVSEHCKLEVQRKEATRNFHSASFTVLEDTFASLSDLSKKANEHRDIITNSAKSAHEHELQSITETTELFANILDNVNRLASSMKVQLSDGSGIIPLLDTTSTSVQNAVDGISKDILNGEKNLSTSCESARAGLKVYARRLSELGSSHRERTKESLSAIEASIAASTEKMSNMVASATSALSDAKNARAEAMKAQNVLLLQWKNSSIEASRKVGSIAKTQGSAMGETIEFFSKEMRHHKNMETALSEQRSLLTENGQSHIKHAINQKARLGKQMDEMTAGHKRMQQMRKEFVTNLITGVRNLVTKQLDLISVEEEQQQAALLSSNESLTKLNVSMEKSAKNIVDAAMGNNESLVEQLNTVQKNDMHVTSAMKQTSKSLADIAAVSEAHQQETSLSAAEAEEGMKELARLDAAAEHILESMKSDGEQCNDHLTATVLKEAKDGIEQLASSGEKIVSYSDGVISNYTTVLNDIEAPREHMIAEFNTSLQEVSSSLSSGVNNIRTLAQKQCSDIDELENTVNDKHKQYKQLASTRKNKIEDRKEQLIRVAAEHASAAGNQLSNSSSLTADVKNKIADYTTNVIRVQEEVARAPERKVHVYSTELSSTPSDDTIIQGLECEPAEEPPSIRRNCSKNEDLFLRDEENIERGGMHQNHSESDIMSVKSAGSNSSASSPVIQRESDNKENTSHNRGREISSTRKPRSLGCTSVKRPATRRSASTPVSRRKKSRLASTPTRMGLGGGKATRVRRNLPK